MEEIIKYLRRIREMGFYNPVNRMECGIYKVTGIWTKKPLR